jgi:hypothetical protein
LEVSQGSILNSWQHKNDQLASIQARNFNDGTDYTPDKGTYGIAGGASSNTIELKAGVYGVAKGNKGGKRGVVAIAEGEGDNYGIYASAADGNYNIGGYFLSTAQDAYGVYSQATGTGSYPLAGITAVYGLARGAGGVKTGGDFNGIGVGNDEACGVKGIASVTGSGTTAYGFFGYAGGPGTGKKYGIYAGTAATGEAYAGYFAGNVHIEGSLTKPVASFLIDHPLDPENKTLRHNLVESPEYLCLYRGKVKLDDKGKALVQMPDYFAALTKEEEATVLFTAIGDKPFLTSYKWNKKFTAFTIFGSPNGEASYIVLADRDDPAIQLLRYPVEEEKGKGNFEKGKLLCPEGYGKGPEMSVHAEMKTKAEEMIKTKVKKTEENRSE